MACIFKALETCIYLKHVYYDILTDKISEYSLDEVTVLWTTGIFTSKPLQHFNISFYRYIIDINVYIWFSMCVCQPAADFKEFELRLKFETRLKYGWFHLKLYSMFPNCAYDMYNLI